MPMTGIQRARSGFVFLANLAFPHQAASRFFSKPFATAGSYRAASGKGIVDFHGARWGTNSVSTTRCCVQTQTLSINGFIHPRKFNALRTNSSLVGALANCFRHHTISNIIGQERRFGYITRVLLKQTGS